MEETVDIAGEVKKILRKAETLAEKLGQFDDWMAYDIAVLALGYIVGPAALHSDAEWKTRERWDEVVTELDQVLSTAR